MAFDSYADLQTAVGQWMARDDLNPRIPDYIRLFEVWINRVLVSRQMTTTEDIMPVDGVAVLPVDFLMVRRLTWANTPSSPLTYVTPDYFHAAYREANVDTPSSYTIEGNSLLIDSSQGGISLRLGYAQKVPPLTDDAQTNWLLIDHPDLYLWGSLLESNAYTQDAQTAILWKGRRDECMRELQLMPFRTPGQLTIQPTGVTP